MSVMGPFAALSAETPVLICGPTASGKSALALEIAETQGGVIVNADASQVFDNWRVLTARPSAQDEARVPHLLYGHLPFDSEYSVGDWLRELAPLLQTGPRPVIVGGTGLYFTALTEGLADIPATPADLRDAANARRLADGFESFLPEIDAQTRARIDLRNPMRVQRAWEVQQATGRGLAAWQDDTPPPLLAADQAQLVRIEAPKSWLTPRIDARFDQMLTEGALDEARDNLPLWNPALLSMKAIGARELIAHLRGELTLDDARARATVATHQFAKRQRTWLRARMADWTPWHPPGAEMGA